MQNLRSEDEILRPWTASIEHPLVSVQCTTYNHEKFIQDALEGILAQITDFPFEIWVHDDASTDQTQKIIIEYQQRYPKIIKTVLQTENQLSQGKPPILALFPRFKGEYLAICEGDDYWCDRTKLAKQVNALIKNPKINLCFHSAVKINFLTGESSEIGRYRTDDGIVPLENIISKNNGQIPTASTLIRTLAYGRYVEFRRCNPDLSVGDIYMHFFGSIPIGAWYINESLSVYRWAVPGSWTSRHTSSPSKYLCHLLSRMRGYSQLNLITKGEYQHVFSRVNARQLVTSMRIDVPFVDRVSALVKSWQYVSIVDFAIAMIVATIPRTVIATIKHFKSERDEK